MQRGCNCDNDASTIPTSRGAWRRGRDATTPDAQARPRARQRSRDVPGARQRLRQHRWLRTHLRRVSRTTAFGSRCRQSVFWSNHRLTGGSERVFSPGVPEVSPSAHLGSPEGPRRRQASTHGATRPRSRRRTAIIRDRCTGFFTGGSSPHTWSGVARADGGPARASRRASKPAAKRDRCAETLGAARTHTQVGERRHAVAAAGRLLLLGRPGQRAQGRTARTAAPVCRDCAPIRRRLCSKPD
jgi:hypothetical protein